MRAHLKAFTAVLIVGLLLAALAAGQAGRRPGSETDIDRDRGMLLNVTAAREDGSGERVTAKDVSLYDGGQEQRIQAFTPDPSPARIVILVDNSLGLRADVEKLQRATREFAYEIYEGDQVMVVGFDQQPEIISDWTDDAKAVEASLTALRKKGQPHLFDALTAVVDEALRPFAGSVRKRAIVLIGDGLDRGSKTKFKEALAELQSSDIAVYAMQIPDRTGGAFRRDRPKPSEVVRQLAEGTGGRVLQLGNPREAAKSICDELRKNRYLLAYTPSSVSYFDTRRLLVVGNPGVHLRFKTAQPPN